VQLDTKKEKFMIVPTLFAIALLQVTPKASTTSAAPLSRSAENTALPVKSVTLFSSGVSFTLREGEVSGLATVPLSFRTAQINDILKSLVLIDEKGQVQPAIYAAKDPVNRTLQSFVVDVTQPMDRTALLGRLRGQVITAYVTTMDAGNTNKTTTSAVTGKIVSVSTKDRLTTDGKLARVELLSLLSDEGLRTVRLDDVDNITFDDPKVRAEFNEALTLLASGADDKRRSVVLKFDGPGKRNVRVGYVTESPLWKVSYRLLLGGNGVKDSAAKPYLQGWALVENTTDEDWNNIALTLVSGRPISFLQDLYQPQYLARPLVGADVTASPLPQLAEESMDSPKDAKVAERMALRNSVVQGRGGTGFQGGFAAPAPITAAESDKSTMIGGDSVASQASGTKQGELFSYRIKSPVSLPRQQAAMIPVVAQEISGQKVSLFNADLDPKFSLNGVKLTNNTALHLKGGPVTLFDEGIYAGDARMLDIPPGDSRILTYAVDLALIGERQNKGGSSVETSISIKQGLLTIRRKETIETVYNFKNKAEKPRSVLVEHPFSSDFKLIAPEKAAERTQNLYRFSLTVAPGKTETLTVQQERPLAESYGLIDTDLNFLLVTSTRKTGVSEKLKAALREVLAKRQKVSALQNEASGQETNIAAIDKDQARIRQNMQQLDRESALYKRYVSELDAQETRIEALRKKQIELNDLAASAARELQAYIDSLDIS
jgi:hypothetical protein